VSSGRAWARATAALVALLASATAAIADDGDRAPALTLAEALAEARAQSPILGAAAEDGRRAAGLARAAAGVDDLVVEVEAEGLVRSSEAVAGAVFQDTELDAVAARAALWQPLPWGGRVGLEVREERARSTTRVALAGPASDVTTTIHSPSVALVWVQPLLRDRGRSAHTAGRRAAALAVEAEAARHTGVEAAVALEVARAYWELAYAERELELRAHALVLARDQLAVTQARAGVGTAAELDVVAVEQAIAAREAAHTAAAAELTARSLALAVAIGRDPRGPRLAVADPLDGPTPAPPADAVARALAWSPELAALGHQARAADVDLRSATDDRRPRLDLIVRGGPTGQATDAAEAWAQLGRGDGYQASAALAFRLPVGDRAAAGRQAAARAARARLVHEDAAARAGLTAAVTRAVDALALSERRIAAASAAAALAHRTVELARDRWRTGLGTSFDVLERHDQALAADAGLARAQVDRHLAVAALAALTGP
jgi:outer membrane protein TolC